MMHTPQYSSLAMSSTLRLQVAIMRTFQLCAMGFCPLNILFTRTESKLRALANAAVYCSSAEVLYSNAELTLIMRTGPPLGRGPFLKNLLKKREAP